MTRSSIWIGVGAFVLAMMMAVSIDPSDRSIAKSGISLGGSPAFAQIQLPDPLEVIENLNIGVDTENANDDDDDDDAAASKDNDDD